MGIYHFLVTSFNHFVAMFPPGLQWLVTLLVLVGLIGAIIGLIRQHFIFIILAILLLPVIVPVAAKFASEIITFLGYLAKLLHLTSQT